MAKIVWLASYPKSGNTWMRAFYNNYLSQEDRPAGINQLFVEIISKRDIFAELSGIEASNLLTQEIEHLFPKVISQIGEVWEEQPIFLKIHNALTSQSGSSWLLPRMAGQVAIYILRNPLDLCASFASHRDKSIESTVRDLNKDFWLVKQISKINRQLPQHLLTWSRHALSWVDQDLMPVQVLRYEDMQLDPFNAFSKAVHFAGLPFEVERIQKAIAFSSFDSLQKQEEEQGFREKPTQMERFFRKGKVGSWREELTSEQAQRIIADHGEVMRRFGYLTEDGQPVF